MSAPADSLLDIRARLRAFASERDWDQFQIGRASCRERV